MSKYNAHLQEVYPVLPFEPVKGDGVFLKDEKNKKGPEIAPKWLQK